jgi:xanthine/CO dehydrogenase XdhC/CoxF family maturation factor
MMRLVRTVTSFLEQGEDFVPATILSHEGSTPQTAGTKTIVRQGADNIATRIVGERIAARVGRDR